MSGIEIDGFKDLEKLLQNMSITETDEKKAMKKAIEVIANEVEKNTPVGSTGRLKNIKKTVKKDGFGIVGIVKMGAFYDVFQEFGTSQGKKHVGFFDRSVNKTQSEAIDILAKELLDEIK